MGSTDEDRDLTEVLTRAYTFDVDDPSVAVTRARVQARLLGTPFDPPRLGRFVVLERIGSGAMGVVFAAFDPQLDRKVAIKLLLRAHDGDGEHDRLRSEARAMAKLAHPNVVHVYEVGEHGGRLFVAMEYVRGSNLRQWCAAAPRSLESRLSACIAAGRGLAAAHAAAVIHRDFKPDNVIVGEDGRVRVADFGLARPADVPTTAEIDGHDTAPVTLTRRVLGTPGYVAPELILGDPATASSDQFALCVTLWETLTGTAPFASGSVEATLAATLAGRIHTGEALPPWIDRILRRGLVGARYPSVDALLDALDRDPVPVRRRRIVLATISCAIAAAAYLAGTTRGTTDPIDVGGIAAEPCTGAAAAIDQVWPAEAREALPGRIATLGGAYARTAAPQIGSSIAAFTEAWRVEHRDACLAHHRGEQSGAVLDQRMLCLDRARAAMAGLRELLDDATADELPALVVAAEQLPAPGQCGDLLALAARPRPSSPEAAAISAQLERLRMELRGERPDVVLARVSEPIASARRLGDRHLLAQLLEFDGQVRIEMRDREGASAPLREATRLALATGDPRLALAAWSNRAWAYATGGPTEDAAAFDGTEVMSAIAEHELDAPETAWFYGRLGNIALARGRRDEARVQFARALEVGRGIGEPAWVPTLSAASNLALAIDDPIERDRLLDEVVRGWTARVGPEHPRTLKARINRARYGTDRVALAEYARVVAELSRLHPHDSGLPGALDELFVFADALGDEALARATAAQLATGPRDVPVHQLGRAYTALLSGEPRAAREIAAATLAASSTADRPWYAVRARAFARLALGRAELALGEPRASTTLATALAELNSIADNMPSVVVARPIAIARAALARTRPSAPARAR